ncbi:MAG: hypothetical protein HY891_00990 [Deltaproteobacteria bacterium]|nr:hypothetical protein [Deltaproteobacteria bacterium]
MQPFLRPIGIGLVLGLLSLFFGVVWALNLTVNHDNIHQRLSESAMSAIEGKFVINPASGHDHAAHTSNDQPAQSHADAPDTAHDHSSHVHGASSMHEDSEPTGSAATEGVASHLGHDAPRMAVAHERLARGHLHAMGLGLLTICVSLMLSLVKAPVKIKTLASACAGIGGFFYPFAWIIMGFRTPSLGAEAAAGSVFPIAAFSVLLILAGILLTLFYVVKGVLHKD